MTHGSLFSGIGGFDLAAQWMGWENVFHCEWNPFGQKILHHYWPNAIQYHDITKTDFSVHRGAIDIISGGFPCQPYSMAGKRLGKEDERHLWPEMLRAIREIRPRWVVGENVLGLVNWSGGLVFHEVQADLEAEGYEVQPFVLPAAAVNAPHRRDRVWFVAKNTRGERFCNGTIETRRRRGAQSITTGGERVADAENGDASDTKGGNNRGIIGNMGSEEEKNGGEWRDDSFSKSSHFGNEGDAPDTNEKRFSSERQPTVLGRFGFGVNNAQSNESDWENFPTVSPICHGDDGISNRLDNITFSKWRQESIKGGGNAVVPQVVLRIFETIEEYENQWTPPNPPASSTSSSPD